MRYPGIRPLLLAGLLWGPALGGWARGAEQEEQAKRRAETNRVYNDTFNLEMFSDPREAQAEFEKAQQQMEKANPNDPGDPAIGRVLFQRGYLAEDAGDYPRALALFEELVKRFPDHAYADDALYHEGYIYQHHLKDYDRAAEAYTRLVKMYSDRENAGPALYQQARMEVERKSLQKAEQFLSQARDNAVAQRAQRGQQAMLNFYENQANEMLSFIRANTDAEKGPEALALYLRGAEALQEGRWEEAAKSFAALGKEYRRSKLADDAAFGLAEAMRRSGRLDEAARAYADFIEKYPESKLLPRAKFCLAEFKHLAGNDREARKLYEEVVQAVGPEGPTGELQACRNAALRRLEGMRAP